jgi:hypothetical protein
MPAISKRSGRTATIVLALATLAAAQAPYTPKSESDPARSNDEAVAIAYMRTVVSAERAYKKKKGKYAPNLAALVGHGSFTKRMARTDRGSYTVSFRGGENGFSLRLTPREFAPERRAFYTDESGIMRVEEDKEASGESPILTPNRSS